MTDLSSITLGGASEAGDRPLLPEARTPELVPIARIPLGLPIRYLRLTSRITCGHCGSISEQTRLHGRFRVSTQSGSGALVPGTALRPLGASEPFYSGIAVESSTTHGGTPRCDRCLDHAARDHFEPLPPTTTRLNWLGGHNAPDEIGGPKPKPKKPTSIHDILL